MTDTLDEAVTVETARVWANVPDGTVTAAQIAVLGETPDDTALLPAVAVLAALSCHTGDATPTGDRFIARPPYAAIRATIRIGRRQYNDAITRLEDAKLLVPTDGGWLLRRPKRTLIAANGNTYQGDRMRTPDLTLPGLAAAAATGKAAKSAVRNAAVWVLYLLYAAGDDLHTTVGQARLAADVHVDRQTIKKATRDLRDAGMVTPSKRTRPQMLESGATRPVRTTNKTTVRTILTYTDAADAGVGHAASRDYATLAAHTRRQQTLRNGPMVSGGGTDQSEASSDLVPDPVSGGGTDPWIGGTDPYRVAEQTQQNNPREQTKETDQQPLCVADATPARTRSRSTIAAGQQPDGVEVNPSSNGNAGTTRDGTPTTLVVASATHVTDTVEPTDGHHHTAESASPANDSNGAIDEKPAAAAPASPVAADDDEVVDGEIVHDDTVADDRPEWQRVYDGLPTHPIDDGEANSDAGAGGVLAYYMAWRSAHGKPALPQRTWPGQIRIMSRQLIEDGYPPRAVADTVMLWHDRNQQRVNRGENPWAPGMIKNLVHAIEERGGAYHGDDGHGHTTEQLEYTRAVADEWAAMNAWAAGDQTPATPAVATDVVARDTHLLEAWLARDPEYDPAKVVTG